MISIVEIMNRRRLNLSHKLMLFILRKRVNNFYFLEIASFIQVLFTRNLYFLKHKKSRHHYIPQFLLRKFRVGDEGLIFEYKYGKKPKKISIKKKVASIENLYTFRDKKSQQQSDFIEDIIFAESVEKYSPIVVDRIIEKNIDLTGPEQSTIAMLIAFQYTRTPKFTSQLKYLLTYLVEKKSLDIDDLYRNYRYKEIFIDNYYNVDNKELEEFILECDRALSGKDLNQFLISISLIIANNIQEAIFNMEFAIFRVEDPNFLYLSDNPVIIFNKDKQRFVGVNIWEITDDIIIFLPISPKVCIIFAKEMVAKEYIHSVINLLSIANMKESVYSDRYSDSIMNSINSFHETITDLWSFN